MSRKKKDRSKELLEGEERFRKKWNEDVKIEGTKAWQLWQQTKKWIEEGGGCDRMRKRIQPISRERLKREVERVRDPLAAADYRRLFQNVPTLDDDALRDLFVESTPMGQILPQSGDCTQDGHLPHF